MNSDTLIIVALQIIVIGLLVESYLIFLLLIIVLIGYSIFLKKENEWRKGLEKKILSTKKDLWKNKKK